MNDEPVFRFIGADLPRLPDVPDRDLTVAEYERVVNFYGDALVRLRWQPIAAPAASES